MAKIQTNQLEELIKGMGITLKIECCYKSKGCPYNLPLDKKETHENECRYRNFQCEGHKFAKDNCTWSGSIDEMYTHFKKQHHFENLTFKSEAQVKIDLKQNHSDVQIISFLEGKQFFFFKHRVDVDAKKIYWVFQFVGPKNQAECYYYEFEIFKGPIKKFKVTEFCRSNVVSAETLFRKGKCVIMPFEMVRDFLDEDDVANFRYRIMQKPAA